jgi:hypothetical protein
MTAWPILNGFSSGGYASVMTATRSCKRCAAPANGPTAAIEPTAYWPGTCDFLANFAAAFEWMAPLSTHA